MKTEYKSPENLKLTIKVNLKKNSIEWERERKTTFHPKRDKGIETVLENINNDSIDC